MCPPGNVSNLGLSLIRFFISTHDVIQSRLDCQIPPHRFSRPPCTTSQLIGGLPTFALEPLVMLDCRSGMLPDLYQQLQVVFQIGSMRCNTWRKGLPLRGLTGNTRCVRWAKSWMLWWYGWDWHQESTTTMDSVSTTPYSTWNTPLGTETCTYLAEQHWECQYHSRCEDYRDDLWGTCRVWLEYMVNLGQLAVT